MLKEVKVKVYFRVQGNHTVLKKVKAKVCFKVQGHHTVLKEVKVNAEGQRRFRLILDYRGQGLQFSRGSGSSLD